MPEYLNQGVPHGLLPQQPHEWLPYRLQLEPRFRASIVIIFAVRKLRGHHVAFWLISQIKSHKGFVLKGQNLLCHITPSYTIIFRIGSLERAGEFMKI